jgi:coatomer subunit delta
MELTGDMNLHISDASSAKIRIALAPLSSDFGTDLQLKQHPNVSKFGAGEKIIALKDPNRAFPLNQGLAVLRWRYSGKDESLVPLSSTLTQLAILILELTLPFSQLLACTIKRWHV